jgi:trehalose 6-phosphate phosphatase
MTATTGRSAELPTPTTAAGRAGLAALIAEPHRAMIAVDFDGTLAPIVADPAAARATPQATAALTRLGGLAGTVAVITGRPAADAAAFAGVPADSNVLVLGHYGRQRWERGRVTGPPAPAGLAVARAELPAVLAAARAEDAWVEDKGEALAVHTRRAAEPQAEFKRLTGPLAALARRTGLILEPGRLVLELRPPGADKGKAIRDLAADRQPASIVYCGDDLGDKPAFEAVRELRAAATPGLLVCSGSAEVPELAASADLVVDGPAGVAALLAALGDALAIELGGRASDGG